jgi:ppGpp synthetase/RelA/SpoT-type nucleotidyltranferase
MSVLEDARKRWLVEQKSFGEFGKLLKARLEAKIRDTGTWCEVSSRPKELDSLIRKLIKKPHYTYDTLGDKCGVRIVFRYKSDVDIGVAVAQGLFDCGAVEHKVHGLGDSTVGYLSAHIDIKLRADDPEVARFDPKVYRAELQVRSLAQHLWSEMAHDSIYKNDPALLQLPPNLKRRVHLLAGVIEVADDEFDRIEALMPDVPEIHLLRSLESSYFKLTARRSDPELSLAVINLLTPLYGMDTSKIEKHLQDFYQQKEAVLRDVYEHAPEDRGAFLFQPEVLMIYDRLEVDQTKVRETWGKKFADRELELVANAFGISFD